MLIAEVHECSVVLRDDKLPHWREILKPEDARRLATELLPAAKQAAANIVVHKEKRVQELEKEVIVLKADIASLMSTV